MALKHTYTGTKKKLPHNQATHVTITDVVKFLQSYTENNAILLPGRIPGYKRDDTKLLPSSHSKKVLVHWLTCNKYLYLTYCVLIRLIIKSYN